MLYDRGRGRAELQRFVSKGSTFKMSVGWKCGRGGLYASRAQLALGDATGDGKADAIVLYRGSPSRLLTFATKGSTFVKKTFWKGAYPAAKLAAGDLDSDGDVDAVCLRDNGDGRMALDAFLSDKTAFAAPAPWWLSAAGAVGATARLACGDLDANGMADAVLLTPTGRGQLRRRLRLDRVGLRAGRLVARAGHRGLDPARLRLRVADHPSREDGRPRATQALAALQQVDAEGAVYTFTSGVPQVDGLAADDVIAFQPCEPLPYGALRKVTSVAIGGGQTVVTTVQATLEEAVSEGELAIDETCSQDDIVEVVESRPGVRLVQRIDPEDRALARRHGASVGGKWEIVYDVTLEDLVTLVRRADVRADVQSRQQLGRHGLRAGLHPGVRHEQHPLRERDRPDDRGRSCRWRPSSRKRVETDLATYSMKTFVVWFGPVPVTFTPEVTLYVGASGERRRRRPDRVRDGHHGDRRPPVEARPGLVDHPGLQQHARVHAAASLRAGGAAGLRRPRGDAQDLLPGWADGRGGGLPRAERRHRQGPVVGARRRPRRHARVQGRRDRLRDSRRTSTCSRSRSLTAGGGYKEKGTAERPDPRRRRDDAARRRDRRAAPGRRQPRAAARRHDVSAADGAYGFADLNDGQLHGHRDEGPSSRPTQRTVTVTGGAATTGQDVELADEGAPGIGGMVAQNGDPVGDVTVELRQGWDTPSGPLVSTVVTTYSGEYTFDDLLAGDYTVVASRAGYFTKRISVTVGDTFVPFQDIDFHDLGEQGVSGYIFDGPDGIAVDGATVTLHEGYHDPDGPVVATTTIGYGAWQFAHVDGRPVRQRHELLHRRRDEGRLRPRHRGGRRLRGPVDHRRLR